MEAWERRVVTAAGGRGSWAVKMMVLSVLGMGKVMMAAFREVVWLGWKRAGFGGLGVWIGVVLRFERG